MERSRIELALKKVIEARIANIMHDADFDASHNPYYVNVSDITNFIKEKTKEYRTAYIDKPLNEAINIIQIELDQDKE